MGRQRRPYIIPIFIPHSGCPHRCVFCNQAVVTNTATPPPTGGWVRSRIETQLAWLRDAGREVEIAFYGGNFLGQDASRIRSQLRQADAFVRAGRVRGIRFSTRPDTITAESLSLLHGFTVKTIEIGAQSMCDRVLSAAGRGHTAADTHRAVELLQGQHFHIGLQMMVGLPEDTVARALLTGRQLAGLKPDFVRIYPTLVLDGSRLAHRYRNGRYRPLTLSAAVDLVKSLYGVFRSHGIPVIRMGLQGSVELEQSGAVLAGPYHPAFGDLVQSERFLDLATGVLAAADRPDTGEATIAVHPYNLSRVRGHKNRNMGMLKQRFNLRALAIQADPALEKDRVVWVTPQPPGE
jgi:histone acetyltransferase (RNA polymerase elongator complex component)